MNEETARLRGLYLDLMERTILGMIYNDAPMVHFEGRYIHDIRLEGKDWPSQAHSMIGFKRMRSLRLMCEEVLRRDIPGDFIETGVWRGGACIMMRAVLKAYNVTNRRIFVCDSFEGLPAPNAVDYPVDAGDILSSYDALKVSQETVEANFNQYGLLDEQVHFVKGWFKDTLHSLPSHQYAIVRLDGDMYESTIQALNALYGFLSPSGFLIVDDYGVTPMCSTAVHDFRTKHAISEEIRPIDWTGSYWQKAP